MLELPDDICSGLEEFICRLYEKGEKEDTDEARNIVFTKKLHNENKSVALCWFGFTTM